MSVYKRYLYIVINLLRSAKRVLSASSAGGGFAAPRQSSPAGCVWMHPRGRQQRYCLGYIHGDTHKGAQAPQREDAGTKQERAAGGGPGG